mmetsp:Transcript_43498/g.137585  ORF Transcript_43498/g.137585 Transcript_43498/m.137585 type:complete len:424 (-) Transcript_43498:1943-3214(-)
MSTWWRTTCRWEDRSWSSRVRARPKRTPLGRPSSRSGPTTRSSTVRSSSPPAPPEKASRRTTRMGCWKSLSRTMARRKFRATRFLSCEIDGGDFACACKQLSLSACNKQVHCYRPPPSSLGNFGRTFPACLPGVFSLYKRLDRCERHLSLCVSPSCLSVLRLPVSSLLHRSNFERMRPEGLRVSRRVDADEEVSKVLRVHPLPVTSPPLLLDRLMEGNELIAEAQPLVSRVILKLAVHEVSVVLPCRQRPESVPYQPVIVVLLLHLHVVLHRSRVRRSLQLLVGEEPRHHLVISSHQVVPELASVRLGELALVYCPYEVLRGFSACHGRRRDRRQLPASVLLPPPVSVWHVGVGILPLAPIHGPHVLLRRRVKMSKVIVICDPARLLVVRCCILIPDKIISSEPFLALGHRRTIGQDRLRGRR